MDVVFAYLIGGLFQYSFVIYCWHKLLNIKIDFKNPKLYVALLLIDIISTMLNTLVNQNLKIPLSVLSLCLINYLFFCKEFGQCIITAVMSAVIVMFGEFIFALFLIVFSYDISILYNSKFGIILINTIVAIISFFLLKIPIFLKVCRIIEHVVEGMKNNRIMLIMIITMLLASILTVMSWIDIPKVFILTVNTTLIVLYLIIVVALIYTHEKYHKIYEKYEISLNSLREYEQIMNKYRVNNHENKNQLRAIRNMIKADDKKTINYIDKVIEDKTKDSDVALNRASKIPEGGIRATIYSEICKMEEAKIEYNLNVSNDIQTADLINLNDDTIYNICQILGVFLDNAIEEVKNHKNRKIIIEMFVLDEDLCIEISNKYIGELNLKKISDKGYTTKGKGHGYGLALVKKIVSKDKKITNEQIISKDIFTQRIIIDL